MALDPSALASARVSLALVARDLEEQARRASTAAGEALLLDLSRKAGAAASTVTEILEGLKSQPSLPSPPSIKP